MRRQSRRDAMQDFGGSGLLAAAIGRHPREFVGLLMVATAFCSISFNALFLQNGPHPAPIFATRPMQVAAAPLPQPAAVIAQPAAAPETIPQDRVRLISDIQRELGRRGYYDGGIDGIWGAKTDAAARDFVQSANVKISAEASDGLLRAILSSSAKAQTSRAAAPERRDPIAELIAPPPKRLLAIQRALADFGYGQIKPTGNFDADTRAAIETFERGRRLPVTGEVSDRFVRELAAVTGRPLE